MNNILLADYAKYNLIKADGCICNASYLHLNNQRYLIARNCNYSFIKTINSNNEIVAYGCYPCNINYNSSEILYNINNYNCTVNKTLSKVIPEDIIKYKYVGDEDIRVVNWNEPILTFTRVNITPQQLQFNNFKSNIVSVNLNDNYDFINETVIETTAQVEKNWQPIEHMPYTYVYSYKPFKLINIKTKEFTIIANNVDLNYCGSTGVINYNNYHITLVHTKNRTTNDYLHYLVKFDDAMNIIAISKPFKFFGCNVEFSVYMENQNNIIVLLVSVHDQITYEFILEQKLIDALFNNIEPSNNSYYNMLLNDTLCNKNILAALSFSIFVNDTNIAKKWLKNSLQLNLNLHDKFLYQQSLIGNL